MGLTWVILPGGKRRKYQGRIAKMQYKDMKRAKKLDRKAQRRIDTDRINEDMGVNRNHDFPWWREPTMASLIGRWRNK